MSIRCNVTHYIIEKIVGNWSTEGVCNLLAIDMQCGPGYQVQRRNCSNGAEEQCSFVDTVRIVSCSEHDCPRELTEWVNRGNCQGTLSKTCGNGFQTQTRNCKDGTSSKCFGIELVRTLPCNETGTELPKCSGNLKMKIDVILDNYRKFRLIVLSIKDNLL